MPEAESRLPCPVCLGVKMSKLPMAKQDKLMLDRCQRCGGMWFDRGEVERLRLLRPVARWRRIVLSTDAYSMSCHNCQAIMDRNAAACPACEWRNILECPVCERAMDRRETQSLHLDSCAGCHGVWFDRIELAEIWNLSVDKVEKRGSIQLREVGETVVAVGHTAAAAGADVAEVLLWNPDIAVAGARMVTHGAGAAASAVSQAASSAPQLIGTAVEVTGDLAGSVFETIADIVGSIFG